MLIPFTFPFYNEYTRREATEVLYEKISETYPGSKEELTDLLNKNGGIIDEIIINCELDTTTGTIRYTGIN